MPKLRFIQHIDAMLHTEVSKILLKDQKVAYSRAEVDNLSGRVYAYLISKGIKQNDFVLIYLPRGVQPYIAQLGVWKAGAACVILEDTVPIERMKYIYHDCGCKLIIDKENWHKILETPSKSGYFVAAEHDACFALYTSGSEGHPKGIIHEYGKLEMCRSSLMIEGDYLIKPNDNIGVPLPISATAAFVITTAGFLVGARVDILPYAMVMNAEWMTKYINEQRTTITGLVPTMIISNPIPSPYIRWFVTGTEMLSDAFIKETPIASFYGQTEVVFIPFSFAVDKPYDNTPIGKPTGIVEVFLLDDSDKPVKEGEIGELCYENPYTRGYINDDKLTSIAFRNGLYHTGDLAKKLPDGNYLVLGRKSDMVKINGNRIEPAEIEAAVKNILRIDWAVAKGFVSLERSYICVYYTENVKIDNAYLRDQLLKVLPNYMIPSYFIHIDEIPRLPNGKVDRQALKAPIVEQYRTDYVAPTNELEKRICQEMEKVLHLEHIGINDDFYLLGGDSLRTISLVNNLGISDIVVTDIYSSRTPKQIALTWMQKQFI